MKFVFRISGSIKFWDQVEESNTGGPSTITVRMEYLLAFQYWYCELCMKNRWRGGRKHCFDNLCFLAVFESSVNKGWWGGYRLDISFSQRRIFEKKILIWRYSWKGLHINAGWLIGWLITQFSQKRLKGLFWFFAWS